MTKVEDEAGTSGAFSVGAALRAARERSGYDLAQVASRLRIRQPYLKALEAGDHRDLPGGTYAIGFLRTYAEFLGLEPEEMVRRFKMEAAGELHARSELVFPSPMSEGRIPSGGLVFVGLVLAVVAYGVWYLIGSHDSRVAEMVPPIPDRVSAALNRPVNLTGDKTQGGPDDTAKVPDAAGAPVADAPASETAAPADNAQAKVDTVVPPSEADATPPPVAAVAPAPVAAPAPVKAPEPVKPAPAVKAPEPVKPAPAMKAPEAAAAPPVEPAAVPATAPAATSGGTVYGTEYPDARIVLRAAKGDCWLKITEMDGRLFTSRLLRKGDSLRVPNRPGLTLTVGDAGTVEIAVDGKHVPFSGNSGQVKHDVLLDPAKLLPTAN